MLPGLFNSPAYTAGMATERLEMHVLREIFRQKLTLQRSHRQVKKALGVSIGKISGALARAAAIGLDADLFERVEKPALGRLPASPFEASTWKEVRLNIDYHFELDHHLYSAPHQLVREELWVRATANAVEVFHRGTRIDSHLSSHIQGARTTRPEHMPSTHRAQAEWTPSRILGWAEQKWDRARGIPMRPPGRAAGW